MTFSAWLKAELDKREWNASDLARHARLTPQAVGNYLRGGVPGRDSLKKIAKGLKVRPDIVLRAAELLPPIPPLEAEKEAIINEINDPILINEDIADIRRYINLRRESRRESNESRAGPRRNDIRRAAEP